MGKWSPGEGGRIGRMRYIKLAELKSNIVYITGYNTATNTV